LLGNGFLSDENEKIFIICLKSKKFALKVKNIFLKKYPRLHRVFTKMSPVFQTENRELLL
jgi:hypothetical protein